jgi:hypothetical protein
MITNKLERAAFTKRVLFAGGLLTVFLFLYFGNGAMKG